MISTFLHYIVNFNDCYTLLHNMYISIIYYYIHPSSEIIISILFYSFFFIYRFHFISPHTNTLSLLNQTQSTSSYSSSSNIHISYYLSELKLYMIDGGERRNPSLRPSVYLCSFFQTSQPIYMKLGIHVYVNISHERNPVDFGSHRIGQRSWFKKNSTISLNLLNK